MTCVRNRTQVRINLPGTELPLTNDQGIVVLHDRRKLRDRRKARCGLADLKVLLNRIASTQTSSQ
jgi:hypothetical protein